MTHAIIEAVYARHGLQAGGVWALVKVARS